MSETMDANKRRNAMIESIAHQLCQDEPVFDGLSHWTMDHVQECMDKDPEISRLTRMIMNATSDFQKGRAAEAYQLLFRRNAHQLAENIVDDVIMYETIKCCHGDFDSDFDSVFKVQGV